MRIRLIRLASLGALVAISCTIPTNAYFTDDLTRPIRASKNGHFLVQPNGEPFFWLGDTGWALFERLDREDADKYLQDRARKGFTVIQAVAWGGPWEDLMDANRYGELPLIDRDPARPNPLYFVSNAEAYGWWIGERYRNKGVIWVLGGDMIPLSPEDLSERVLLSSTTSYLRCHGQRHYRGR
jgi:uncharacterized protein DUF4038